MLAVEGFLPGYGVYEGGIVASARRGASRQAGPRAFDLSRSNVVGLREFVPGNRIYANRGSYYVARYHLGADETARIRTLRVDPEKGYVTEHAGDASYGQTGGVPIDALPLADLDLAHESRITEDENLRFSMPVTVLGRLRKRNRGGVGYKIGDQEVSYLRGQGIELVNVGEAGRVKQGEIGHWICSVCGAAKSPYAVPTEVQRFLTIHKERCGKDVTRLALAVQADVDLLRFHDVDGEAEGINVGEALRTAATRLLDMGPDDLQLLLVRKPDDKLDLLIYDPMPGGSGLLEQMLDRWRELVATAKELLAGCVQGCETACYACLKTFRNQFYHDRLNRHEALELIADLDHRPEAYRTIVPVFEEEKPGEGTPSNTPEARLQRLLLDHQFPAGVCRQRIVTSDGLRHRAGLAARAEQGRRLPRRHEPGPARRPEDRPAGPAAPGHARTGRLHGDRRPVPRPGRSPGGPAAPQEPRPGDRPGRPRRGGRVRCRAAPGGLRGTTAGTTRGGYRPIRCSPSVGERPRRRWSICDERCRRLVRACLDHGRPLPVVGYELQDEDERICADAELAWEDRRLAVLLPDRAEGLEEFRRQGWTVFLADDLTEEQLLDLLSE